MYLIKNFYTNLLTSFLSLTSMPISTSCGCVSCCFTEQGRNPNQATARPEPDIKPVWRDLSELRPTARHAANRE